MSGQMLTQRMPALSANLIADVTQLGVLALDR